MEESGDVEAGQANIGAVNVEYGVSRQIGRGGNVTVAINRDENGGFVLQETFGQLNGLVGVIGLVAPRVGPEIVNGDLFAKGQDREVGEDFELLGGGGSPVGEARADGEAFLEDGAEVRRECEIELGLHGTEFIIGEAFGDGDVAGFEVLDDFLGICCE